MQTTTISASRASLSRIHGCFRGVGLALLILATQVACEVSFSLYDDEESSEARAGTPAEQQAASAAALAFLDLVDGAEYEQAWTHTGPSLRDQSDQREWTRTLKMLRRMSVPEQRQLHGYGFTDRVDPALPLGEFVVVEFKAVLDEVTVSERVVMEKHLGQWKTIGYHVEKHKSLL